MPKTAKEGEQCYCSVVQETGASTGCHGNVLKNLSLRRIKKWWKMGF